MNQPRMWYAGDEIGWVCDVQDLLTPAELQRCIDFTLKAQAERFIALLPGEKKDECARTMIALKNHKVRQNVVGVGDHVLMSARSN